MKKMEQELEDLQKWSKLGLVPKQEEENHQREIVELEKKIIEEKERIQQLKNYPEEDIGSHKVNKSSFHKGDYTSIPTITNLESSYTQKTEFIDPGNTIIVERDTSVEKDTSVTLFFKDEDVDDPEREKDHWKWIEENLDEDS